MENPNHERSRRRRVQCSRGIDGDNRIITHAPTAKSANSGILADDLSGKRIAGTAVGYGRADHRFGFATLEPLSRDGRSTATFHDGSGMKLFACAIAPGDVACN